MDETPLKPRKSQRSRKEKDLGSDFISSQVTMFLVKRSRKEVLSKIPIVSNLEKDPKNF